MDNFFRLTEDEIKSYAKGRVRWKGYYNLVTGMALFGFFLYLDVQLLQTFSKDYNLLSISTWISIYKRLASDSSFHFTAYIPKYIASVLSVYFLIKFGAGKFIETRKISKYLCGVSGQVVAIENNLNREEDMVTIKVESTYIFDEDSKHFNRVDKGGRSAETVELVVPSSEHEMMSIYKQVYCIYGQKSKELYKIQYEVPVENRKYEISTYKKIETPADLLAMNLLPEDLLEDAFVSEGLDNKSRQKKLVGEIIYAKAMGSLEDENISWAFTLLVKEIHAMKKGRAFDSSRSLNLGQRIETIEDKYDYYILNRTLDFNEYKNYTNQFHVGECVIMTTNKRYTKLHDIKQPQDI